MQVNAAIGEERAVQVAIGKWLMAAADFAIIEMHFKDAAERRQRRSRWARCITLCRCRSRVGPEMVVDRRITRSKRSKIRVCVLAPAHPLALALSSYQGDEIGNPHGMSLSPKCGS